MHEKRWIYIQTYICICIKCILWVACSWASILWIFIRYRYFVRSWSWEKLCWDSCTVVEWGATTSSRMWWLLVRQSPPHRTMQPFYRSFSPWSLSRWLKTCMDQSVSNDKRRKCGGSSFDLLEEMNKSSLIWSDEWDWILICTYPWTWTWTWPGTTTWAINMYCWW